MGATPSMAGGHPSAHRPRRRPPGAVRWPRRIAGILATGGLLGAGVLAATMIVPSQDATAPTVRPAATATPKPAAKATKRHPRRLTRAQRRARAAAVGVLRSEGYLPVRVNAYNPRHTLRVLVGYRNGDPGGPRRAFFFARGRFLGHDALTPSASLKLVGAGNRSATLSYGLYASGDKACCPSAGRARLRFTLHDGALQSQGIVPSVGQRTATG